MAFQKFTGMEYLKMDIAARFGLDKEDWNVRLKWYEDNKDQLMNLVTQADEPAQYVAAVKSMFEIQQGIPSGYPISIDATSSGLQILAAITNDDLAARLCNVTDTGKREDAYKIIYEYMKEQLGEQGSIKRDDTKTAIMTSLYGSEAEPKRVFGENTPMLRCFYKTMKELAPSAWLTNEAFLNLWQPENSINSWVLPDNFHVHVKVIDTVVEDVHFMGGLYPVSYKMNQAMPTGRSLGANSVHSIDGMIVREIGRRCNYDPKRIIEIRKMIDNQPHLWLCLKESKDDEMVNILWSHYKETGYLSARILDHLQYSNMGFVDTEIIRNLIDSLPKKPFQVLMVHDCFRCLPEYGNDLRMQYNIQLYELAKSEILSSIVSQIIGRKVKIGKQNPNMVNSILEANYALA